MLLVTIVCLVKEFTPFFNVIPLGSRVTNTWSVWNLYNTVIGFNCRLCWQSKGQVSSKRRGVVDDIVVRHWTGLWLGTENQQNKTGAGYELHNIHFLVLKLSNAGQTLLRPNILLYEITKTFLKNLSYFSWFSKKPTDVYFYQNIFTLAVLWYKKHLLNKTSLPIVSCHFVVLESNPSGSLAADFRYTRRTGCGSVCTWSDVPFTDRCARATLH